MPRQLISRLVQSYHQGDYLRQVGTLASGASVAQILPVIISPALTRIYTPEQFGLFGIIAAFSMVLSVVACGRYEFAILLPKKDQDAEVLLYLSQKIALGVSVLILVFMAIFNDNIAGWVQHGEIAVWLFAVPVSVGLTGYINSFNYINNRRSRFDVTARSRIFQAVLTASLSLILGIIGFGFAGLVIAFLAGQVGALCYIRTHTDSVKKASEIELVHLAKRYSGFILYSSPAALLNSGSSHLPTVLLGSLFSPAVAGFYSLTMRILSAPMGIVAASVGQVYFGKASRIADEPGLLSELTYKTYLVLMLVGCLPIAILSQWGVEIFVLIFGREWGNAGQYAAYFSVWMLLVFTTSPISHIYSVRERQKQSLLFNLLLFASRIGVLLAGAYIGCNENSTLLFFGVVGAFLWWGQSMYLCVLSYVPIVQVALVTFGVWGGAFGLAWLSKFLVLYEVAG